MQPLNGIYAQKFNRGRKRTGPVLQGRFKTILVEKESHLLELARYVVLNPTWRMESYSYPLRTKMVRPPRGWQWSSYRGTAGHIEAPEFLTIDWILSQFDAERAQAIRAYRHFVSQGRGLDVWDGLRAGSLLGSDAFIERMRPLLLGAPPDPNILRRERDAARPNLAELFSDLPDKETRTNAFMRPSAAITTSFKKLETIWIFTSQRSA